MSHQHQRQAGIFGAGNVGTVVGIVDDMLEVDDEGSFTVGALMSEVIVGIDHGPLLSERAATCPYRPPCSA
jgi:hypothetical protein